MTDSPYIAPRLTLRVGVTGHRPNKLGGADEEQLRQRAWEVLGCLAATAKQLLADDVAAPAGHRTFASESPHLRLASAIAEGSDRLVAKAALDHDYRLNLIFPFPKVQYANDFAGPAREEFEAWCRAPAVESCTQLDLNSTPHDPDAYRKAGLLTLAHSDVLIAIWDEDAADGVGGTAEIVAEAQRRGVIVVLIRLSGELRLWTVLKTAVDPVGDGEWRPLTIGAEGDRCSNALAERVRNALMVPARRVPAAGGHPPMAPTPAECLAAFRGDRLRTHTYFFGYELLRTVFLPGRSFSFRIDNGLVHERKTAWRESLEAARNIAGESLRDEINARLRARWIAADNVAVHYSHRFRTAYVMNFTLAFLAVLVGLLIVFWMENLALKGGFVATELFLIGTILWNTRVAHRGR